MFVVFGRTHERNERDNSEEYALAIEKSIIENAVFFAPVSENDRNVLFSNGIETGIFNVHVLGEDAKGTERR